MKRQSLKWMTTGFSHGVAKTQNFKKEFQWNIMLKTPTRFSQTMSSLGSKTSNASDMTCSIILGHMALSQFYNSKGSPQK